jgi:hypothetical protein
VHDCFAMRECNDKDFHNMWTTFAVNTQYHLREEMEFGILSTECWY